VAAGFAGAKVHIDHQLRAIEEVLTDASPHPAVAQNVGEDRDDHVGRRGTDLWPDREVALRQGLGEIGGGALRKNRVPVFGRGLDLAQTRMRGMK